MKKSHASTNVSAVASAIQKLSRIKDSEEGKNFQEVFPRPKEIQKKKGVQLTKRLFWDLWKKHGGEGYVIDKRNEAVVTTVFRYFLNDPNFDSDNVVKSKPSLDKGLLIYGDYGIGKTWLFEIIHEIGKDLLQNYGFRGLWFSKISAGSFVEEYMNGVSDPNRSFSFESYFKGKLYIDDLGFEKKAFNKTELFGELLFERDKNKVKTFVTTNLKPSEISNRYGERIFDRVPQMFNVIKWEGESFRLNK